MLGGAASVFLLIPEILIPERIGSGSGVGRERIGSGSGAGQERGVTAPSLSGHMTSLMRRVQRRSQQGLDPIRGGRSRPLLSWRQSDPIGRSLLLQRSVKTGSSQCELPVHDEGPQTVPGRNPEPVRFHKYEAFLSLNSQPDDQLGSALFSWSSFFPLN